ncbi:MAG TPA: response regulator [Candidatus Vogelbacteria bacterium]|nr:response regulator [Candidatus Vogelbacteria bacterium]
MKIILIEDATPLHEVLGVVVRKRGGDSQVVTADNLEKAEEVIQSNLDADILILDGSIIGGNTVPLLKKIRNKFEGKIIAFSGDPKIQAKLLKNGADIQMDKSQLAQIFEIISV